MNDLSKSTKTGLKLAVRRLLEEKRIFGVQRKLQHYIFGNLEDEGDLSLEYDIALLPPDKYFLPSRESLVEFDLANNTSAASDSGNYESVIFGIHPYDLHALKVIDAVYSGYTGTVIDTHYLDRRKSTVIIGVDCLNPWSYSFAESMGTSTPPPIFDLWLTDLGDEYVMEVGSMHGRGLLKRYFDAEDASRAEINRRSEVRAEAANRYSANLEIAPSDIPSLLDRSWDNPVWDELGEKCFSCGSCTMVCPTCVCYNVTDRTTLDLRRAERFRQWDSCMFSNFTLVAGGETFRETGAQRLRHRLFRKGKYMLERWGELGCVGCGRCVHACLVDIASPANTFNRLTKETAR